MNGERLDEILRREAERRAVTRHRVGVCGAASCHSLGSTEVRAALERGVREAGLEREVEVFGTGCLGLCQAGPLVQVETRGEGSCLYGETGTDAVTRIVRDHLAAGRPVEALRLPSDLPFFTLQRRLILSGSGQLDPERIESCIAAGAYRSLQRVLASWKPWDVVAEVTRSGLRGRGGAGYPTGRKWAAVASAPGGSKVVICNADEGDPGAFMNRSVLEGDPHRVLEGMAIAGYAVGADRGYVYVRGEHPLTIERLRIAIEQAGREGLLGQRLFGSGFDFTIELRIGAGAYVCGEETALIASVEGRRGTPRPRPPYPAQSGLRGLPTLINNVETFANVPAIIEHGGAWLAAIGTEHSKGTKVFALAGSVVRTGLVEVPFGTALRQIVYELGGGIPGGKAFKAAQTGGPSGGCIPARFLDLPVDYEALLEVGSYMGSGGLIILDESSCMVDVAAFFMEFCRDESCGKCVPCRAGTAQLLGLLRKLQQGEGSEADLELLEELGQLLKATSLCGLGQGAPSPVLSTLRWFRDEYLAHVRGHCPAGVCGMRPPAPAPTPSTASAEARP